MSRARAALAGMLILLAAGRAAGQVTYGDQGLEVRAPHGTFTAVIGFRNQVRFTTPVLVGPVVPDGPERPAEGDFRLNRSRLRVNGQLFSPRLAYQFQADFVEERVRDLSVTWTAHPWLRLRAGRWKVEYNRERMQSSSAQQLVDRSIVDRWFTLGRQQGAEVFGRIGGGSPWGGTYHAGAFRGVDARGGAALPVWLARYQWSWAGREVDLEQGDLHVSPDLRLALGTSVVRTESAYAFYSGAGVGHALSLPWTIAGEASDRYRTRQYAGDADLKWRGLSFQSEVHRKEIRRTATGERRTLVGGYLQGGVLASLLSSRAPRALEFAARFAVVDPSETPGAGRQQERVIGANWYFDGHRNKLTVDVSQLRSTTPFEALERDVRTRVQWEFSF